MWLRLLRLQEVYRRVEGTESSRNRNRSRSKMVPVTMRLRRLPEGKLRMIDGFDVSFFFYFFFYAVVIFGSRIYDTLGAYDTAQLNALSLV